jgi:hypothetical protein
LPDIRQRGLTNFRLLCVFRPEITRICGGIVLAIQPGMSPIARALHHRFEEVCRTELVRLRRKTAALAPADREQVDAISAEVTRAIAASVGAAVDGPHGADLGDIVSRLFAISPADAPQAHSV